eukprot:scaffold51390_cov62-Phaeocystis_antarctica.AAC.3
MNVADKHSTLMYGTNLLDTCISGMSSELTRLPAGDANYERRDDVGEDKQCARLVCTSVRGQRRARHADPEN